MLIPLGVLAVRPMVPAAVLDDCRAHAQARIAQGKPVSWIAAAVIVAIWLALTVVGGLWLLCRST